MRRPRLLRGGAVDPTFVEWLAEIMAPPAQRVLAAEEANPQYGRLLTATAAEYITTWWKTSGSARAETAAPAPARSRWTVSWWPGFARSICAARARGPVAGHVTDLFPGGTKAQLARGVWRGPVAAIAGPQAGVGKHPRLRGA